MKYMIRYRVLFTCIVCFLHWNTVSADIRFANIFGDHMVLQRDVPNIIWGWGTSENESVTLHFNTIEYKAVTDQEYRWQVTLPPISAGGPYEIILTGTLTSIQLQDIYFGDLWLCSGQSNMAFGFTGVKNLSEEKKDVDYPMIRQLLVGRAGAAYPEEDVASGQWSVCSSKTINNFSAVAFFFAKEMYQQTKVPIGIINNSWGGAPIEAFIPKGYFKEFPKKQKQVDAIQSANFIVETQEKNMNIRETWTHKFYEFSGYIQADGQLERKALFFDNSGWVETTSEEFLEDQGIEVKKGISWLKKTINLSPEEVQKESTLNLGQIKSSNICFINGVNIGVQLLPYITTVYKIPEQVLRAGENEIMICVFNEGKKTGFTSHMKPVLRLANQEPHSLTGLWYFKQGNYIGYETLGSMGPGPEFVNSYPSLLFNGMIAPFRDVSLKGVLWYQGEANRREPQCWEYEQMLENLIMSWRDYYGSKKLPFLIVQLPNYGSVKEEPIMSAWNIIQEAQGKVAQRLNNTDIIVTHDVGDPLDIHPRNKQDVGKRLSLLARKKYNGEKNLVASGPSIRSVRKTKNKFILKFNHVGSGLICSDGSDQLESFSVAGKDQKFYRASAIIDGERVVVHSKNVPDPQYIRYGYESSPRFINFYNKDGLPAVPFRTDSLTNVIDL